MLLPAVPCRVDCLTDVGFVFAWENEGVDDSRDGKRVGLIEDVRLQVPVGRSSPLILADVEDRLDVSRRK